MTEREAHIVTNSAGNGCTAIRSYPPIVAESWGSYGPPERAEGLILTAKSITAVRVGNGPAVATRTEKDLPDGVRAAIVEVDIKNVAEAGVQKATPLDSKGVIVSRPAREGPPLERELSSMDVRDRNHAACKINVRTTPDVTEREASAVEHIRPVKGLALGGFQSCASVHVSMGGAQLTAGILLNAVNPGGPAMALPKMKNVTRGRSVVEGLSQEGDCVARRIDANNAWLVVTKGSSMQQREVLLRSISAVVHM